jgi:hypothetical protein
VVICGDPSGSISNIVNKMDKKIVLDVGGCSAVAEGFGSFPLGSLLGLPSKRERR